ncbi:MAG: hypothetical protein ACRC1H_19805, partial [Caldilineaceae bacterium]
MAAAAAGVYRIDVDSVDELFNAPDVDPFSPSESSVLGQAALETLLTQLQLAPLKSTKGVHLVIGIPTHQLSPDVTPRLAQAIRRYAQARVADNQLQVRLSRKQHLYGLLAVTVIVLIAIAIAALLLLTVLATASTTLQTTVMASVSLFSWVILWGALEALLFDWTEPAAANRALHHL